MPVGSLENCGPDKSRCAFPCSCAAQSSFLGRGGARAAFAPGWGDAGDGDAGGGAAQSASGAASLTALLDWRAPPVTSALAPLPLHALLGLPRRYTADCEAAHARDVARAVAEAGDATPAPVATPAAAAPAPPRQQVQQAPPPPAAVAPPAVAPRIVAPPLPPPAVAAAADDDDAFLDEMLGPG